MSPFRFRNRLLVFLLGTSVLTGFAAGAVGSNSRAAFLGFFIAAALTALIATVDAAERSKPLPHSAQWLMFFFWVVLGPIYAILGRGFRKIGWGFLTLSVLFFSFAASFAVSSMSVAALNKPDDRLTISFHGEEIELSKSYWPDYDSYKEDPENLSPGQGSKLESAITNVKIPTGKLTRRQMVDATYSLVFPGFGTTSFTTPQDDGTSVAVTMVEIPFRGRDRVLVFHEVDDAFVLIDDFVWTIDQPVFHTVRINGGSIFYLDFNGNEVRESSMRFAE